MKKIVLGCAFVTIGVAALPALAAGSQTFCNGGAAGNGLVAATASQTDFVKVPFTPKCSANVFLVGNDRSATLYTVGSASIKGKSSFGGSSAGGGVVRIGDCAASPCAVGDATAGEAAAPQS
ncbi:MAG: hypothetical protein NFW16_07785 [Candidatus Accumulibacter sp.]|uniref:hypothetical protein n=1 Tax=Accumulibacter sp. TaxID=2053492 RepID=UPI00258D132E|nr:hypothetical protein [Accumulibacter sp.]MCM8621629.1 hypothetical protein [Accumulibacter sp.]